MTMWKRRKLYPKDWVERSRTFKESREWRCEHCGVTQGETRISRRTGLEYIVWLHAAHKHLHETQSPEAELLCLCPSCHGAYDYDLRMREIILRIEVLKHRALIKRHFSRVHARASERRKHTYG